MSTLPPAPGPRAGPAASTPPLSAARSTDNGNTHSGDRWSSTWQRRRVRGRPHPRLLPRPARDPGRAHPRPRRPPRHPVVVLVCESGVRAEQARRHLAAVGLVPRCSPGGVRLSSAAGGEVVRGRPAWALERQVRLVAGALVVTGLAAGRLISPKARLLAAGIGTGLTVSALTDTCAIGAALERLPWNRDRTEPTAADALHRVARRAPRG